MKQTLIFGLMVLFALNLTAQRFISKTGHIYFTSEAPLETIEAHNNQVNSALDTKTGDFIFKIIMKSFVFEKALMQEHFNENYVESDLYPNAVFLGKISNLESIDFTKEGSYKTHVVGNLNLHGVDHKIDEEGVLSVSETGIHASSVFHLKIADYNISIPGAVTGKIADAIEIHVDVDLKPL